jgi:hypothetical protein
MLVNKVEMGSQRLLIRPGAIGDFIVSLPALEFLRGPYTEVWTSETNLPLVRFADVKRSIIASGLDRLGLLPADDVMERLRGFDSIVSWYGSNRREFRELVADAGLPFQFLAALPSGMHAVDYYCRQVGAPLGAVPRIDVGPVERHGKVVIHPFASRAGKRWPGGADFSMPGFECVKLRGPDEHLEGAVYIPDLFDLARFLAGAAVYIGNDSGITHLAAAVGTPTIALFGPTDPTLWAPRGRMVKVIRAATMADISAEEVVSALSEVRSWYG